MSDLSLTTSRVIRAPREKVFNAWLDPEMLTRFMIPGPGTSAPKAETDPVEGGRFAILFKNGEDEMPHAGTYTEISRHDRLVFTWESPFSVDGSTVTLEFRDADGGTEVTLTHMKFADEESRNNHNAGWSSILEALEAVAVAEAV